LCGGAYGVFGRARNNLPDAKRTAMTTSGADNIHPAPREIGGLKQ